jgi:hypothetical protein
LPWSQLPFVLSTDLAEQWPAAAATATQWVSKIKDFII